jgi:general secretion pathway protein G
MLIRPVMTRSTLNRRAGFTLLEVMAVLAILIIIASLAVFAVMRSLGDAKEKQAKLQMQSICNAMQTMYINDNRYPDSLMELVSNTDGRPPLLVGNESAITSPWGQIYQFEIAPDNTGTVRPRLFTTTDTGRQIVWPEK